MTGEYEFQTTIPVRFRDIDAMGHVNNAVYATYLEQARADYHREIIGESLADVNTVLVSLAIDFKRPIARTRRSPSDFPSPNSGIRPSRWSTKSDGRMAQWLPPQRRFR